MSTERGRRAQEANSRGCFGRSRHGSAATAAVIEAAVPDRFNGVLVRKCLDAVWQAGAVFCLLPPHVAWIKECIEQHMLMGAAQLQHAKTEGGDADAQLQQAKSELSDADAAAPVADTPGAPTLS